MNTDQIHLNVSDKFIAEYRSYLQDFYKFMPTSERVPAVYQKTEYLFYALRYAKLNEFLVQAVLYRLYDFMVFTENPDLQFEAQVLIDHAVRSHEAYIIDPDF
jgi:hypothetical protein